MQKTNFSWVKNNLLRENCGSINLMNLDEIESVRKYHMSFPEYKKTPLVSLNEMAKYLGVSKIWVKDESYRFGLNAFKVLGSSYAMGKYIAKKIGKDIKQIDYKYLSSEECKKEVGDITFFSATDGNHGRGVAWTANRLNQKSIIYMPYGTTKQRLQAILDEGSKATIENLSYDDCVRKANEEHLKTQNSVVIQDTSYDDYEEIPSWIMQGYGTLANEVCEDIEDRPTHIFLQVGVGSFAGSVIGYFVNKYKENPPKFIIVETSAYDCFYRTVKKNTGEIINVAGENFSIMAGLCCGEPCGIAFDIIKNNTDVFVSASDDVTRLGMRMLASPLKGDNQVISGESGAVPFGTFASIMLFDEYEELRKELFIDKDSKVLFVSTEGNTDKNRYEYIVWNGMDKEP